MSNVVVFRPERTGPVAIRRRDEPVQIFFFTGVRYIRDEVAPPPDVAVDVVGQVADALARRPCRRKRRDARDRAPQGLTGHHFVNHQSMSRPSPLNG